MDSSEVIEQIHFSLEIPSPYPVPISPNYSYHDGFGIVGNWMYARPKLYTEQCRFQVQVNDMKRTSDKRQTL